MLTDFFLQFICAGIFFLAIAGVGALVLRLSGYKNRNLALDLSLAYFLSLCIFTVYVAAIALSFPEKKTALFSGALLYGSVSTWIFIRSWKNSLNFFRDQFFKNRKFISVFSFFVLGATFLFFLQVYQTSILDEWLHRPIVQSFANTGVFPLVNPLDPTADYIQTYHYGTQLVAVIIQMLSQFDVSSALDVFKLSCFLGTYGLFFGLIYFWTEGRKKYHSLIAATLTLFVGSSFFLLDSFTASHIASFFDLELQSGQRWSINGPLAYILSGITWANVPIAIAFAFSVDFLSKDNDGSSTWKKDVLFGIITIGFFIISELFAAVLAILYVVFGLIQSDWTLKKLRRIVFQLFVFGSIILFGVFATGGVVGNIINQVVDRAFKTSVAQQTATPVSDIVSETERADVIKSGSQKILSFKVPREWGYPSEKRTLSFAQMPFYYVRSLLLEICILGLFIFAFIKKKQWFREMPMVATLMSVSLVVPAFFSTSFGDLNLAKLLVLGLALLHLFTFYWLIENRLAVKKWVQVAFLVLFLFGAIPGIAMGPNIQWQLISKKGREQYCSQNPMCYKGEFTELLRKFENEHPGLKHIQTDQKNASKIVDLTNSYVYRRVIPGVVKYVIETPEFRKVNVDQIEGEILYESGDYRIWRIY